MPRQSLREREARKGGRTRRPNAIIAERTSAIEQMNSSLRRRFNKLEKSVNDLRADNLRYYHNIGVICEEIRESPETYVGKDGTPGLKLIEQALSTQARTLRKAALFARTYSPARLETLIGLVNSETNFQLHWGHVSFLLTLPTEEKQDRFAAEAVEKMLDPPALHDLIKKRTQRSGGHGRTHAMPKTVGAQIRQILTICKQWTGKNSNVWNGDDESVFGNIMNMPVDDMEPDMVEQLTEIEGLMTEISESAGENVEKTRRAREHLAASIKKREDAEKQAKEHGKQHRAIDMSDNEATTPRRRRGAGAAA